MKPLKEPYFQIEQVPTKEASYLLNEIPDKPPTLYMCGNKDILNNPTIKFLCIIGSRKYTDYGREACQELIRSLVGKNVAIVSGLALGIDGIAHQTALELGIPCIAVPGSGLDESVLYPRTHIYLAKEIVNKGGLLVSEYEPTFRASPWSFPMRNRIMAGLSHAILIIEGEKDSGTLITAKLGLEYNRDILAPPGSIFSVNSEGPLSLIKRGAIPITCGDDLLSSLGLKNETLFQDAPAGSDSLKLLQNCSKEELLILNTLKDKSLCRDDIFKSLSIDFSHFQVCISVLEIRGFIIEECGTIRLTDLAKKLLLCNTNL